MDKVYKIIGKFHKYQIIIIVLISITQPIYMIYTLVYPFFTKIPNFKCISNNNEQSNEYFECEYNDDLCKQNNYTFIKDLNTSLDNWAYSFDLYCDKEYYSPMISTSYFLGTLFGFLFFGKLPDVFGRKKVFMYLLYITCFCYLSFLFPISPIHIIIIYFIGGTINFGDNINTLIILELIPREKSGKILGIINSMFPFLGILISLYFMFINDYILICAIFFVAILLLTFFCHKYLLESPRWLLSKQKNDELIQVFEEISIVNETHIDFDVFLKNNKDIFSENKSDIYKKTYSIFEVLKYKTQRNNAFLLLFIYFSISFIFYGIILNLGKLKGNFHANSIMVFLGEAISCYFSGRLIDLCGRLIILKYSLFYGSIFLFAYNLSSSNLLRAIFLFLSMIGYSSHNSIIGIFISETFPTCIRSMMYSYLKFFSLLGPLFVPYASHKLGHGVNYFFILFGFIGYIMCFYLEETKGKELQDIIPEEVNKEKFLKKHYSNEKNIHH